MPANGVLSATVEPHVGVISQREPEGHLVRVVSNPSKSIADSCRITRRLIGELDRGCSSIFTSAVFLTPFQVSLVWQFSHRPEIIKDTRHVYLEPCNVRRGMVVLARCDTCTHVVVGAHDAPHLGRIWSHSGGRSAHCFPIPQYPKRCGWRTRQPLTLPGSVTVLCAGIRP